MEENISSGPEELNLSAGGTILGEPDRVEDLGCSQVPYQLFLEYIFGLGESSYKPGAYDLLKHNCNNFSEEVSEFLCGRGIPKTILTLPDEVLNTDLGEILAPLAKSLQLKEKKSIPFGGAENNINSYVPREVPRQIEDPELEELNSAIEEVRHNTLLLENRRNSLNEKLLKKERKERKKEKREKKKKKNRSSVDLGEERGSRRKKRGDSVHTDTNNEEPTEESLTHRRFSEPVDIPIVDTQTSHQPRSPSRRLPPLPPSVQRKSPVSPSLNLELPSDRTQTPSPVPSIEVTPTTPVMEEERTEVPLPEAAEPPPSHDPLPVPEDEELPPETPREPPIIFKEEVDTVADFDGFVHFVADMLSTSEQKHMEELRAYVVEDEGSWALGEDFNSLFARIFHDPSIPWEAQRHLLRIMAAAALKDDVILMLHQDRKEHTIMNFANKIESLPPEIQEALALFFCNMFEHLSPSEWLLYISEWQEGTQQISNIRVTTKIAVNALLHSNPRVQEYGTALMYNLGTKEVKTVVFDDVAPELAMAILQYLNSTPPEEYVWRVITALCRFCYASSEVPALIKMIGPDPNTFKGMSERVDNVLEEINGKVNRVRAF
ncbi:hypothetical protein Avbf_00409 [Armadillidium vulgare]|nr:hypothetical protein Avbf_00409 [Armadillidium vulgare]